jgi:hypothetical protein
MGFHATLPEGAIMEAEVAERFKEFKQNMTDQCSSKVDMARLREELAAQFGQVYVKFAELESRLELKMTRLEANLIKWFVATSVALVSVTFAIARYVH